MISHRIKKEFHALLLRKKKDCHFHLGNVAFGRFMYETWFIGTFISVMWRLGDSCMKHGLWEVVDGKGLIIILGFFFLVVPERGSFGVGK